GIVLDRNDSRRNTGLITLEIYDAQLAFMSTAAMPQRDVTAIAASPGALLGFHQGLVRLLRRNVIADQRGPIPQRLGCRSVSLDCHNCSLLLHVIFCFLLFFTCRYTLLFSIYDVCF